LTELSDHQPHGRPAQKRETVTVETFPVLGETAASVEPGDASLDDPALRQHHELADVAAFDDLHVDLVADRSQSLLELRPLVAAVGIELEQERKQAEHCAHQQNAAVAVLNVSGMDDGMQEKTLRIYKDVALLSLDPLARIIAWRVNRDPPFSVLLTLWLSMIATVGLASAPTRARHCS
jgi:hypothetical protein